MLFKGLLKEEQTDLHSAPLKGLLLETRVVSVWLLFFQFQAENLKTAAV